MQVHFENYNATIPENQYPIYPVVVDFQHSDGYGFDEETQSYGETPNIYFTDSSECSLVEHGNIDLIKGIFSFGSEMKPEFEEVYNFKEKPTEEESDCWYDWLDILPETVEPNLTDFRNSDFYKNWFKIN
jgi:hypothetical protein